MVLKHDIKNELINNINAGLSINSIAKNLNLAKSTVYYHYRKIKGGDINY